MTMVIATLVLAAGTYAFRFAGPALRSRVTLSPKTRQLTTLAAVVLLSALVATDALIDGQHFVGFARPAGVLVGGALAWRKAPFIVVVLAAMAITAGLRLLNVR
ncbi:MAG: AzlD domain-containing protein [Sciscionella sp.]|nr:AzlD domain-containing protein [Sciscionella sp.]